VSAVQRGMTAVLLVQLGVLGLLAATVGLNAIGWAVGIACGVTSAAVVALFEPQGPADRVTLGRGTLVGGVAALTAESFAGATPVTALAGFAVIALVLDGVDGQVARRTGTTSDLGARLDMEVDAFLILVLSVYVSTTVGAWVLVVGAAHYLLLLAGAAVPWLRQPSPPRYWGKVVAATTGIALTVAAAGVLSPKLTTVILLGTLALLAESFGRQVWWLHRHRIRAEVELEAVAA
jgi:phosphatidylglycerophosphate synthase